MSKSLSAYPLGSRSSRPRHAFAGFVFALLIALAGAASAAPGDYQWSLGFPTASGIATSDSTGEVTSVGTFFGSVDFGGGTLNSMGMFTPDFYAAHWDANGSHVWSFQVAHNNGFGGVNPTVVATDAGGNIYIGGMIFDGEIDFGGGMLFGPNLFVLKLNSAGVHQWSATFGDGVLNGLDVSAGGLALTGNTSTSVDFGGGSLVSAGARDAFVAVLDSAGGHVFSAIHGDAGFDQSGNDIAIDASGNVFVGGGMQGTVDFGGGPLVAGGVSAMFLAAFDSVGTHLWSHLITGSFAGGSPVVQVKPYVGVGTSVAIAGEMRGAVDFGGGSLSSNGQADIYLATYDPTTGAHEASANWGATTSEIVQALSIDSHDNYVISGTMLGPFDAGGGTLPYNAFSDLFVAVYDGTYAHVWSKAFGTSGSEFVAGNAVDGLGEVLLFGGAGSGIDFGGGPHASASLYLARFDGTGGATQVPALRPLALFALAASLVIGGVYTRSRQRA